MKYKLIACDVDGTLLDSKHEMTQRTKDAIVKTIKAGVLFVTATGRPLCNIEVTNSLFEEDMPFIVFNGSAAYMGKSKKELLNIYLDFDIAKEVFETGRSRGLPQIVWTSERLWASYSCEETIAYRDFSGTTMDVIGDFNELRTKADGVSKVLWINPPEIIKELRPEMTGMYSGRTNCYTSMPHFLEFVSTEASKGAALAEIGRVYGIDRSEMIAVGDAYNDVSMLEYAGLGVAMANAPDDIKALCDHVTLSNNDDGVAAVIEKFIL